MVEVDFKAFRMSFSEMSRPRSSNRLNKMGQIQRWLNQLTNSSMNKNRNLLRDQLSN